MVQRSSGAGHTGFLFEVIDLVFVGVFELMDVSIAFPTNELAESTERTKQVPLLDLAIQLIAVLVHHTFLRTMRPHEPHIVNLCPPTLCALPRWHYRTTEDVS